LGLIGGAAALVAAFIWIESRSRSPLLPLRIFRLRALSAANVTMALVGAVTFSEFFVLTLYVQDVLHYSAVQSGVAFSAFALSVVVTSNLAQAVVARFGIRATLISGLAMATVSLGLLTQLPVGGHYFWDLFPAFVLGGAGLGFSFVPVTIASLAGVERADAGVASGLVNTSRQIGGAIGLAAISTIAASAAASYAHAHGVSVASAAATVDGFQTSFVVLGGLLVAAIVVAGVFLRPARERAEEAERFELEEAAGARWRTGPSIGSRSTSCFSRSTPSVGSNFCSRPQGHLRPASSRRPGKRGSSWQSSSASPIVDVCGQQVSMSASSRLRLDFGCR